MGRPEIVVVGAGVSGLTTAVYLAERQHKVRLVAELPPTLTTSAAAGASWGPYLSNDPQTLKWSEVTRSELELMAGRPRTGVRLISGLEVSVDAGGPPEWATKVRDFEPCTDEELRASGSQYLSGWRYTIPLVDMPQYLDHLSGRLLAAGGTTQFGRRVRSFDDLRGDAGVLVNCTGLGSRELVPDRSVYATRGQLVVVENPGIDQFFQDTTHDDELTYIFPHGDRVVLGGCATKNAESHLPASDIADAILQRCVKIEPRLSDAKVLEHRVGLRPNRETVRVEKTDLGGVPLIHNYGHGAVGVSLSWGCAEQVRRLIH